MKKTKFLSLLVFAPLLVSCGAGKYDEPKFVKYGDEVKVADFAKHFSKASTDSALNKKAKLGSLLINSRQSYEESYGQTRNKKVIRSSGYGQAYETKYSYDSENVICKTETNYDHFENDLALSGGTSLETSVKMSSQQQISKVKGKSSLVSIDLDEKTYSVEYEVDKDHKPADDFDKTMKLNILSSLGAPCSNFMSDYNDADSKEKKNYKFYENGKIFTLEYKVTEEIKEEKVKGSSSEQWTIQIDFTEGKWALKTLYKEESEVEVIKSYTSGSVKFAKGDVLKEKYVDIEDNKVQQKNVKLSALDLADYDLEA